MAIGKERPRITDDERSGRLRRLRSAMAERDVGAVLVGSTESLRYLTGLSWHGSERLTGAVVTADDLVYVTPGFERTRVETLPRLPAAIRVWEEEESSASLVAGLVPAGATLAVDDAVPAFLWHQLARVIPPERLVDAGPLLRGLRVCKSPTEIAVIAHAMAVTLEVHRRAHAILKPGIAASEVARFIDAEHRALGADDGSTFAIVSFGDATALPHGADGEQHYRLGDVVLVDTGCRIDGYHSDLTRTYMLDDPTPAFERIWRIEREAQQAVFDRAGLGVPCSALDDAARAVLAGHGLGPDYRLPGLPHRAGHGLGLEIHEDPYIVRGNGTPLAEGMVFSVEPMIVVPDAFGVRLEDHVFMTAAGPAWFTTPSPGPTTPFG